MGKVSNNHSSWIFYLMAVPLDLRRARWLTRADLLSVLCFLIRVGLQDGGVRILGWQLLSMSWSHPCPACSRPAGHPTSAFTQELLWCQKSLQNKHSKSLESFKQEGNNFHFPVSSWNICFSFLSLLLCPFLLPLSLVSQMAGLKVSSFPSNTLITSIPQACLEPCCSLPGPVLCFYTDGKNRIIQLEQRAKYLKLFGCWNIQLCSLIGFRLYL